MNALAQILSSRVRAELFRLMFGVKQDELHVRELARRSGLNESTIRQELRKLKRLDLVIDRRDGNRIYYRCNQEHPLYADIYQIVLKTAGLADVLRRRLAREDIAVAFIFGSITGSTARAHSDVDLMAIGSIGLRNLTAALSGVSEEIGREINPHVMTAKEYKKRLDGKDHFVTNVIGGKKLFIVGTQNEFAAMG